MDGETTPTKVEEAPIIPLSYSKPVKKIFSSLGELTFNATIESANFARLSLNFLNMPNIKNFNMSDEVTETVFAIFCPEKLPKVKPIGKRTDKYEITVKADLNPTEDTNGLLVTGISKI